MGIGGSILLLVIGAILTFGINNQDLGPLNLDAIGWILMIAGLVGLVLTLYLWNSRRGRAIGTPPPRPSDGVPGSPDQIVEERYERRDYQ